MTEIFYALQEKFKYHARKLTTINNKENGLTLFSENRVQAEILLDGLVSASNHRNGLEVNGSANVKITSSQFVSNDNDGVSTTLNAGSSLEISTSLIGANGNVGMCIFPSEGIRVKISHSNFTAHYY
uniref:Uncharacterized protein n=1 Tax=Parascaris univalens TaxID=6257 RepID=A0A914ZRN4_PARUN